MIYGTRVDLKYGCPECGHQFGEAIPNGKWLNVSCARCGSECDTRRDPNYKPRLTLIHFVAVAVLIFMMWVWR